VRLIVEARERERERLMPVPTDLELVKYASESGEDGRLNDDCVGE